LLDDRAMSFSAVAATVQDILPWRDLYRQEMNCQVIHDSLHSRPGWTEPYLLQAGETTVGYGSVCVGGPWTGKPALFEYYVLPAHRTSIFDLFCTWVAATQVLRMEIQSNDPLITPMLHLFGRNISSDSILFHDRVTTSHVFPEAVVRRARPNDVEQIKARQLDADADWLATIDGEVAATGGILYHYNRPYGDIYMHVAESFRRRGVGAFLVQELKRHCYERGSIPSARCNPSNVASRHTLQRAGFVPCGHILLAEIDPGKL
jgi:GNAT superfamily N-acetyltransferase